MYCTPGPDGIRAPHPHHFCGVIIRHSGFQSLKEPVRPALPSSEFYRIVQWLVWFLRFVPIDHTSPALCGGQVLGIKGFPRQKPPGDSRVLVRQCYGGHLLAPTSNEGAEPFGSRSVTLINPLQDRMGPLDEDSAHIDVTPATDSPKLRFAARAMLAGH